MLRIVTLCILFAVASCSKSAQPEVESSATAATVDEARALEIAKAQIAEKETWGDRAEYSAKQVDGGWAVTVWRLPKTPGGHRLIEIDGQGSVTAYLRGR